jgi:predicted membrane-bound mannosyltransferase
LNQILFGLFGSSVGDIGVRLGSVLFGTAIVLLPVLWRKRIGRVGALAASIALAISPTMVFASRTLDGAIVVAACALGALGLGLRYLESHRSIYLVGFAISIGLALLSGAGIITLAIVLVVGLWVVYRWSGATEVDELRSAVQELRQQPQKLRRAAWWGGAVFGLVATVGLTHVAALGSVTGLASAWLTAWQATGTTSAVRLFQILVVYEPLIVLIGLIGLVMVIRGTDGTSILLATWSLGAMLIVLLQPGRQPVDLVLVLTPLALLAGTIVERVLGRKTS